MAIEEMILLNMTFDKADLKNVLFRLKKTKDFYPQSASKIVNNVKDVFTLSEDEIYTKMMDQMIDCASSLKLDLDSELHAEEYLDVKASQDYLNEVQNNIQRITIVKEELTKELEENEMTYDMLNCLSDTDIDLEEMTSCQYVTVRFGRVERRNMDKLEYYQGQPFIFKKLGEDKRYIWCCYMVTNNIVAKVDNIFQALGFDEVQVPSFVHGTIEKAKSELKQEIHAMQEYIMKMDQKLVVLKESNKIDLLKLYATLKLHQRIESYKTFVVDYKSKEAIYGFIPRRAISEFKEVFKNMDIEYQEMPSHIFDEHDVIAPTLTSNPFWAAPFTLISKVKQSDRVDTTLATAALYIAVFMLLLGDFGVGLMLGLLGMLLTKKQSGKLLQVLGFATLVGGLFTGKAFYIMTLYPALLPTGNLVFKLLNAVLMLIAGSFTISTMKAIYNEKSMANKVFSVNGVVGLMIVYAVIAYITCTVEIRLRIPFLPFIMVVAVLAALIIIKKNVHSKSV